MIKKRRFNIQELRESDWGVFQDRIANLEKSTSYPLGDDRFESDHGNDYFAFFTRLGKLYYYVVLEGEEVIAVAAAILRQIQSTGNEKSKRVWYLCDLKVRPESREQHIPFKMFVSAAPKHYLLCSRGYAISMDTGVSRKNRVALMMTRFPLVPISTATKLGVISLDYERMKSVEPILRKYLGSVSYLSLEGKKDIILESTQSRMPLLHVQFGHCAQQGYPEPIYGYTHMFCSPIDDPLLNALSYQEIYPSATATVIHHRMENWDWRFILTSDI